MSAHSQYGEDKDILGFFGDHVGRFLDVGAHDGQTFSNTGQLAERGWSGVCVEPSPSIFRHLIENHKGRPIELVNAAIAVESKLVRFWDNNGDAMSTLSQDHKAKWVGYPFHDMWLKPITWDDLLSVLPGPYDFLNIDVEGINAEVALFAPLDAIGARMICLEDDLGNRREEVLSKFRAHGYKARQVGLNILFAR